MEMLISMTVISILMAASLPMITQFSSAKTGVDKNVSKCIINDTVSNGDATNWYTDATGNTSEPTTEPCKAAVTDTRYNRGRAVNTALWFAGTHGTAAQKLLAKKILRAACDLGGEKACDYFIDTCRKDGVSNPGYTDCDDTSNFLDLSYYLHLNKNTYPNNNGAVYIESQMEGLLPKLWSTPLMPEITGSCGTNQNNPNAASEYQNLGNNVACELSGAWAYIKACNLGYLDACQEAYDNNWNQSCSEVKRAWSDAPSDWYNLTYDGASSPVLVNCNMFNLPSAAITGCNASPYVPGDCTFGYDNYYNRSCSEVMANWSTAPSTTYNLTSAGVPPIAPVATDCTSSDPGTSCIGHIGAVCDDGTKYAGNFNGNDMFVPPADTSTSIKYDNGGNSLNWNGANSTLYGRNNFVKLLAASDSSTDLGKPYLAAQACKALNDANYLGHNDWYLPAVTENIWLCVNKTAIGGYSTGKYHTSTENSYTGVTGVDFNNCSAYYSLEKDDGYRIRCARINSPLPAIPSPPVYYSETIQTPCNTTAGTRCSDGTIFLANIAGHDLYVTPVGQGSGISWNNNTTNYTFTGATNYNDGEVNQAILDTLVDASAPYNAAKKCKDLNTANEGAGTYGHNDWYLPAASEVNLLRNNAIYIGLYTFNTVMWSSTETSYIDRAFYQSITQSDIAYSNSKSYDYSVRCIRKD